MKKRSTEQLINRLDKYLRLMRYDYSSKEKLVRLNILKDYYDAEQLIPSDEVITAEIEVSESLAKKLILPLKVRGIFLTEGRPKRKYYGKVELKASVKNPINTKFPLMLDHRDKEAGKVIGMVDKIRFVENVSTPKGKISGIRWWGHINDETFARNVMDKAITEVSVTVVSSEIYDERYGVMGVNLTFKELSLVMDGSDPFNYVEVDK